MIEFHPLALQELRRAQAWYRDKSRQAAERFFDQTGRTIDRILSDPASHAPIGKNSRYVRIARFPYVLIYRVRHEKRCLRDCRCSHISPSRLLAQSKMNSSPGAPMEWVAQTLL